MPNKACTPATYAGAKRPDGWWAPGFELDSSEEFGSVSLVGSPQPYPEGAYPLQGATQTQAVGRTQMAVTAWELIEDCQEDQMDIHHAMIVRCQSRRLYEALIQQKDLEVWMDAPALARPEVGAILEFQYDQGQRILKLEVAHLENENQVQWRVIEPIWPGNLKDQLITWTLIPQEASTLVDFRMEGWPQDDEIYASLSYKWASFMMRLKIYLGDMREIATLPLVK